MSVAIRPNDTITRLEARISHLEAVVEALLRENKTLREENAQLRQENAQLRHENQQLCKKVDRLTKENQDLQERLKLNSKNSSLPPSRDFPKKGSEAKKPKKRGARFGHQKVSRKWVKPDQIVKCHFTECPKCGSCHLQQMDEPYQVLQQTDIPPPTTITTEYQLFACRCSHCGRRAKAPLPKGVRNSAFGPGVVALIVALTTKYHLSKRKAKQLLADLFRFPIALGSVSHVEARSSEVLKIPWEEVKRAIRRTSDGVYADETGWKTAGSRRWLWLAASNTCSFFQIAPSRSREAYYSLLGRNFKHPLITDGYPAYAPQGVQQSCWAHLDRKFERISHRQGDDGEFGQSLKGISHHIFHAWHLFKSNQLTAKALYRRILYQRGKLKDLLDDATVLKLSDHARRLVRRLEKDDDKLWLFSRAPWIEPTNNLAEREIRDGVIYRKISFGTQTSGGERFVERSMTTWRTLQRRGVNFLEYMRLAYERHLLGEAIPSVLEQIPTL